MDFPNTRDDAIQLDDEDLLRSARPRFLIPENVVYLVGHSLGPASLNAIQATENCLREEWTNGLVGSWNTASWFDMAKTVGDVLARFIGVNPSEVMVTDTVSINLFKLAMAALPMAKKKVLYIDTDEFPTDQYMADSVAILKDIPCHRINALEQSKALSSGGIYIKSAVCFRTSRRVDMARYEEKARKSGAIIIWDLSHATGVIELELAAIGAQLASGCTYKYLNAGPGAPAFVYISEQLHGKITTPLPGWMGHARPFAFEGSYSAAQGVSGFASGTPPILSLSALKGALECFKGIKIKELEAKAGRLGDMCVHFAHKQGLSVTSPVNRKLRGGHVSIEIENAYPVSRTLHARGFHTDFRTPSTIRFGCSPLFIRYVDIWDCMHTLGEIILKKQWDKPEYFKLSRVT